MQSVDNPLKESPFAPPRSDPMEDVYENGDSKKRRASYESESEPRAILLRKLEDAQSIEHLFAVEQQKSRDNSQSNKIARREP